MLKEGEQFNRLNMVQQPLPNTETEEKKKLSLKDGEDMTGEKPDPLLEKRERTDESSSLEHEADPIKDRLLKFLENERILQKLDGYNVFDSTKLNDTEFVRNLLGHHYLGRKEDGKQIIASKKIIFDKLADLEVVSLEDYLAKKERGEKITPIKISDLNAIPELNDQERKEEVKTQVLEFLEKYGVLQIKDNLNVMNLAKLRDREFYDHLVNRKFFTKDKKSFHGGQRLLFETLADSEVISKEDFSETIKNHANIKTKPLFNIPESANEAFNLEKLKNKEYYLNFWDLYSREAQQQRKPQWNYQIIAKNGEKINAKELGLATELFKNHQGKRDENGKLLVFDKEKNCYVKASAQWIIENVGAFGKGSKNNSGSGLHKPHQFLLKECPNLLAKDIIRLDDFRQKTIDNSGNLMRKEFHPRPNSASVPIGSASYYIEVIAT